MSQQRIVKQENHIKIRPMLKADITHVVNIQAEAYGDYFLESEAVIAQRFTASPHTAWIAELNNIPSAYLTAYFSVVGKINPLDQPFIPASDPNVLYLHDLAIMPAAQGVGLAKSLLLAAEKMAINNGFTQLALLSVQNSKLFWFKLGFCLYDDLTEEQQQVLNGYRQEGCDTQQEICYMIKQFEV